METLDKVCQARVKRIKCPAFETMLEQGLASERFKQRDCVELRRVVNSDKTHTGFIDTEECPFAVLYERQTAQELVDA